MKPRDIEKLHSATVKKSTCATLLDFWVSAAHHANEARAAEKAEKDRPDFGWSIALKLAVKVMSGEKLPAVLKRPQWRWVRKAMVRHIVPRKTEDESDLQALREAELLHNDPEVRPLLQAALLTRDATVESVAAALGMEVTVVEAFEALFFNVLDRKSDVAFLRNAVHVALSRRGCVYMAENADAYCRTLLNAGMSGTLQDVLHLAGCGRTETTDSPAEDLKQKVLAAGSAWLAANRDMDRALPPIVAQALDLAKKSESKSADDQYSSNMSTGTFAEIMYAQFEHDADAIRADVAYQASLETGEFEAVPAPTPQSVPAPAPAARQSTENSKTSSTQIPSPAEKIWDSIKMETRVVTLGKKPPKSNA